jgi:hypothetical protein
MAYAYVERDPFARHDLEREEYRPRAGEFCQWCGHRNWRGNLYRYRLVSNGGRSAELRRTGVCSRNCQRILSEG